MNENFEAWHTFYLTGCVTDYIKYKQSIKKETETFDQNSKRNCNSGKQLSGK